MVRIFSLLIIIASSLGCSLTAKVSYDYDRQTNFSEYKKYSFLSAPSNSEEDIGDVVNNDLMRRRVVDAIDSQLTAKGFIKDEKKPDFLVVHRAGAEDRVRVRDWGYSYSSHYRRSSIGTNQLDVQYYKHGTLIIDVIDAKTKQLIWRATTQGSFSDKAEPEEVSKGLKDATARMLQNFPPEMEQG